MNKIQNMNTNDDDVCRTIEIFADENISAILDRNNMLNDSILNACNQIRLLISSTPFLRERMTSISITERHNGRCINIILWSVENH